MKKMKFTEFTPYLKSRVQMHLDFKDMKEVYGIQQNVTKGVWAHVVVDNEMLLFDTKSEALGFIEDRS